MTSLPITRKESERVTPREEYRDSNVIPATQEEKQATSQDLFSVQPDDLLPSNQASWSNQSPPENLQDEFDALGLLTQYLGPAGPSSQTRRKPNLEDTIQRQTESFKKKYLEFTELLDRATSHLESLLIAKNKGRTPARLRITTKPVVVRSDDSDLQLQWAQACRKGELLLIEVLINHLEKVVRETRDILRDVSGQTYKELKRADASNARQNMEEALEKANTERKLRTENRAKRKLEAGPSKPAKKPKDN